MKAVWVPEIFAATLRGEGFTPVDIMSVLLTHLGETIRNNLAQLFSYKDLRKLLDGLEPEYKRLLDEIIPSSLSNSGFHAVLRQAALGADFDLGSSTSFWKPSPRSRPMCIEASKSRSMCAPAWLNRFCADFAHDGVLRLLRLGQRWETALHQALRRDAKGEVIEFDIEPALIEQFSADVSKAARDRLDRGQIFVLVAGPDIRPYVRMVTERMFPNLPVLSHLEIARGMPISQAGSVS